ncbi:MAG: MarR family winged helix-turn-helix transcriptional regulator [Thermoleophilia bacterium]
MDRGAARSSVEPSAEVLAALGRAAHEVHGRLADVLCTHGCRVDEWRALDRLAQPGPHSMTDIGEATLLPGPSVTRLIDGLVADALVYRRADEDDRRRVLVQLTSRGRALQRRMAALVERERATILGELDAEEVVLLTALLDRLR